VGGGGKTGISSLAAAISRNEVVGTRIFSRWCCSAEGGGSALHQRPEDWESIEFQTTAADAEKQYEDWERRVGQLEDLVYSYFLLENAKRSGIRVSEIAMDPIRLYMEYSEEKVDKATEANLPCLNFVVV